MKTPLKHLICAAFIGLASAPETPAQEAAYWLTFENQTLKNSGTTGGVAESREPRSTTLSPELTLDPELARWTCELPAAADGKQGVELVLPASQSALRLNQQGDALAISTWIKWQGPDRHGDRRQMIVSTLSENQQTGWAFSICEDGKLRFDWRPDQGPPSSRESESTLSAGQWHHVAMSWQNDVRDGGLSFWIDGLPAGITRTFTGGGPLSDNAEPVVIGATQGYLPLNGSIADFRIFTEPMSETLLGRLAERKGR